MRNEPGAGFWHHVVFPLLRAGGCESLAAVRRAGAGRWARGGMMTRKLFISGLGVGLVAVVMVGVSLASASTGKGTQGGGGAQHNSGQTLRFTAPPPLPQDQKQVDVPPRGLSLGDE